MKLTPTESTPLFRSQRATATAAALVERPQHLAATIHPLGHLAHQVQGNDALGLDPDVGGGGSW